MSKIKYKWLAVHIFYNGNADELLKHFIEPIIRKWQNFLFNDTPWFFIRYWEGGNHIRLRLNARVEDHDLIIQSILDYADSEGQNKQFTIKRVQRAAYIPEICRYGHDQSIFWAEQHFASSSFWILNWFFARNTIDSVSIQAIKLHLMLLFGTKWKLKQLFFLCNFFMDGWLPRLYHPKLPPEEEKAYWLNQFAQVFKPVKETIQLAAKNFWSELENTDLNDELKSYLLINTNIIDQYKSSIFHQTKQYEIVSSFMHMTNNRLGISNQEEAYIMFCIIKCLEYIEQTIK